MLGRVYEYFLGQFAGKETGKDAGAFYTPRSRRQDAGRDAGAVPRPRLRPGLRLGRHVRAVRRVREGPRRQAHRHLHLRPGVHRHHLAAGQDEPGAARHRGRPRRPLGRLLHQDLHPDLRADFVLANPPFNVSNWWDAKLADDPRWKYGTPPEGNANFAWVQHFIYHLSPRARQASCSPTGRCRRKSGGEGDIRRKLVEADLVDCIVAMPDKLFFNTAIPVSLWFVSKDRHGNGHRKRQGEVLFIDARKLGAMETAACAC